MQEGYISSERFIHDELIRRAQRSVNHLTKLWRRNGRISPVALSWPAESVKLEDGRDFDGIITMPLPTDEAERMSALKQLVAETKAYGLLLIEQRGNKEIKAIFETHHGSKSWALPIKRHGDVWVLGKPKEKTDVESVGLLWRPRGGVG